MSLAPLFRRLQLFPVQSFLSAEQNSWSKPLMAQGSNDEESEGNAGYNAFGDGDGIGNENKYGCLV